MENFFGDPYMMWHDGIDPEAVLHLEGEEREQAKKMLLDELEHDNYYAVMGLRVLKCNEAVPELKRIVKESHGKAQIEAALALNTIEETTEYVDVIIDILLNYPSQYVGLDAARALRHYNSPEVIDALYEGVLDREYLVRYHSADSLLVLHGFEPGIADYEEIFRHLAFPFSQDASLDECTEHHLEAYNLLRELLSSEN